jgi:hypothetical protein
MSLQIIPRMARIAIIALMLLATSPALAEPAQPDAPSRRRASVLPELPSWSRLWASHDENLALIHLNYHVMPGEVAGD